MSAANSLQKSIIQFERATLELAFAAKKDKANDGNDGNGRDEGNEGNKGN